MAMTKTNSGLQLEDTATGAGAAAVAAGRRA